MNGWKPTLTLVFAVAAARLAYLFWLCPYALIEDEAHYWEWARHLDWSYYSKGPGIAWSIAASTALAGDTEFGVRLFAPVFGALAAIGVAGLAGDAFGSARARFFAAALVLLSPVFQFASLLITIDGPMLACWALGAWAGWRALNGGRAGAWAGLGAALAVGFLFKYTTILLIPGLALYALFARTRVKPARVLLTLTITLLGLVPIIVWNAQHGWATMHHLLGHLGLAAGDLPPAELAEVEPYSPLWTLGYLGLAVIMMGFPALLALYAAWDARRRPIGDPARRAALYCLCGAAPVLAFYLVVSFFTDVQPNWIVGAYVTLLALAAPAAADRAGIHRRTAWRLTLVVGLVAGLGVLRLDMIAKLPGLAGRVNPGRLLSAPDIARDVQSIRDQLRNETGLEPIIMAEHYGRASLLAFYLPDHPTVYSCSAQMIGRRNQYDIWPDTDLDDPRLLGRPAIILRSHDEPWPDAFERQERYGPLPGDHKSGRPVYIGYGYRGF